MSDIQHYTDDRGYHYQSYYIRCCLCDAEMEESRSDVTDVCRECFLKPYRCQEPGCTKRIHPDSDDFCAEHELEGAEYQLRLTPFDMETQAEVAKWRGVVEGAK